jgi:GNAT superfamily N-acetyltransferase
MDGSTLPIVICPASLYNSNSFVKEKRIAIIVNIRIRPTKEQDVHILPEIERSAGECFRSLPALAWVADDGNLSAEEHLQYVMEETSWVSEVGDQVIGFLCAHEMDRDLHIEELAVHHEWQGQGIGRRLLQTVIEYARRNGFRSVTLTTFREVPWNEPFYRSMGFEIIAAEKMDTQLEEILHAETARGFSAEKRCAMRLWISSPNENII